MTSIIHSRTHVRVSGWGAPTFGTLYRLREACPLSSVPSRLRVERWRGVSWLGHWHRVTRLCEIL